MSRFADLRAHFLALFNRGFGLGLQFAMNIALSRVLGAAGMGVYSLYVSWMMLLGSLAEVGMGNQTLRSVSVLQASQRYQQIRAFIFKVSLFLLSSGLTVLLLVWLLPHELKNRLLETPDVDSLLILAAVAALPFVLMKIFSEALKGLDQVNLALSAEKALLPTLVLLFLGFVYYFSWSLSVQQFIYLHIGLLIFSTLFMLGAFWLYTRHDQQPDCAPASKPFTRSLLPFWGAGLLNVWFMNMPIILLTQFATTADVGVFSVAFRLIAIAATILVTLASIFGPRFARAYASRDIPALRRGLRQSQQLSLLLFIPMAIVLGFFAEPILSLFGEEFRAGREILWILTAGQFVNAATGLVGFLMNMIHQEKQEFYIQLVITVLTTLMIWIMGTQYGVIGVTIAYALGIAFKNLTSLLFSLYHLKRIELQHETIDRT
jgi:O-antigen/teichoic acid export membrane protein